MAAGEVSRQAMENAYKGVEQDALERTQPQDTPRAILLGGQPGAGKSELAAEAARELRQAGGAVVIDADRMREENPRYKQLSLDDPQHAADRTQKEAGEWATRLRETAMESHRNLIIDGTMRDPEASGRMASALKESGYQVEARILAVSSETSITRARLRYEEQVAARGTGRFVNPDQHDNAYTGIPRSVEILEREKLVDRISVYNASQLPVYENSQERGEWKKPPEATRALEHERSREWTHAEKRDYVSALEDIATLARQRTQEPDRGIEAKLETARGELSRSEQTPAYQRTDAFMHLSKGEALAMHPDLDGAFAQLRDLKKSMGPEVSQDERERSYFNARAELANQLERGEIPRGSVTRAESEKVIDLAAAGRGIKSVRDADELQRDVKGEVAAVSSQHALVKLSDDVAVRFRKDSLDRDVNAGDKVAIQYGQEKSQVYEQGREPGREAARDFGRDIAR